MDFKEWPLLNYDQWKETYETLHLWAQVIGKISLCRQPWVNHSWASAFHVTPRGLSTSTLPANGESFSFEFDFIDQCLRFSKSDGHQNVTPLISGVSVRDFYERTMSVLADADIGVNFSPIPNEIERAIPFYKDTASRVYNPQQARIFWIVLTHINAVMNDFRSRFIGKCSPVHFFWGSFDLAVTRFSGRLAPKHPGGVPHLADDVVQEAYSHEVSSCGFWPGNAAYPHAAFYSYAYPEPEGFASLKIEPDEGFYHQGLKEFLLPYQDVRGLADPADSVMRFFQSTYEAAADLGDWDRQNLEVSPYRQNCQYHFVKKNLSLTISPDQTRV